MVRLTLIHLKCPPKKRNFLKTLLQVDKLNRPALRFSVVRKHFIKQSFSDTLTSRQSFDFSSTKPNFSNIKSEMAAVMGISMLFSSHSREIIGNLKGWFTLAHKHKHKPTYAEAV